MKAWLQHWALVHTLGLQMTSPMQDGSARVWNIFVSVLHSGRKWRSVIHLLNISVALMVREATEAAGEDKATNGRAPPAMPAQLPDATSRLMLTNIKMTSTYTVPSLNQYK